MMKRIGVMDANGNIHSLPELESVMNIISPPVDFYIEKYGPEFYNDLMPLVEQNLSPENWEDFKKHPKEVKEQAIRMMIDEGLIYWKDQEKDK